VSVLKFHDCQHAVMLHRCENMVGLKKVFAAAEQEEYRPGEAKKEPAKESKPAKEAKEPKPKKGSKKK